MTDYGPLEKPSPVVSPGDFIFSAAHLDHGHLLAQVAGLIEAGGTLRAFYDPDPQKVRAFLEKFPQAQVADSLDRLLEDPEVRLIAAAAIPCDRAELGCRVMQAGKDYFTAKAPVTSLDQLTRVRAAILSTGQKYAVYYCERLAVECAIHAGELIRQGAIGEVVQVIGTGPHRLNPATRPDWFFQQEKVGGILTDIGSHQIEQFLFYTGSTSAQIVHSAVANYAHPEYPEFEDFGEANLISDRGASHYFRVDWLTPQGLRNWGDGRTIILGTTGFIELRKYLELAREEAGEQLYLVNTEGEQRMSLAGKVGFPFFGHLILDCLERTERAMTQEHALMTAELCLLAQKKAVRIK